jgi:glycerate 2-kinase
MVQPFLVQTLNNQRQAVVGRIVEAALHAADPRAAVTAMLKRKGDNLAAAENVLPLAGVRRIRVIGAGKASPAMAQGVVDVLGDRITEGLIISKHGAAEGLLPPSIRVRRGGHPVPNADSIASTEEMAGLLARWGGR